MKKIRSFDDDVNNENKRVILRSDFNVPIMKELIQDKTRIDLSVPFIQKLKEKPVHSFHLGRPKNGKDNNLSLKPYSII